MHTNALEPGILIADTITKMPPTSSGAVIISGSHGGIYPGYLSAKAQVRAVILNDAGVGKDAAGIEALPYLERLGIAAATVSHLSCRIGDTADMWARGYISHANAPARAAGTAEGMTCREAARLLALAPHVHADPPALREGRDELAGDSPRRILLLDSASLVTPQDAGQIIVTGSHGGLVGGIPAMALRTDGFAAVFSDAGVGIENAGTTRLPALDARGIPAVTVSADSARIGDAHSIFEDGVVSAMNVHAQELGARTGLPVRGLLLRWAEIPPEDGADKRSRSQSAY